MSKKINSELDRCLRIWGLWRSGNARGLRRLGYAGMTPEARLRESPGRSTKHSDGPDYWPNRKAMRIDARLHSIPIRDVRVLYWRYGECLNDREAAARENMDAMRYRAMLLSAMRLAADALDMRMYVWSGDPGRKESWRNKKTTEKII